MVPNYSGGGVPKYSAEWWKRASISLAAQNTTNENLPPTARTALHLHQHGLTKNEHSRFAQERLPACRDRTEPSSTGHIVAVV